ncbi:hypothetical protein GE09DRAFT_1221342 [Coniochaeta sp. 2T2.1]|nr:hypothetical protein GE09DRAFT_1221342 [Coniochaeta sp. 2T2.1]
MGQPPPLRIGNVVFPGIPAFPPESGLMAPPGAGWMPNRTGAGLGWTPPTMAGACWGQALPVTGGFTSADAGSYVYGTGSPAKAPDTPCPPAKKTNARQVFLQRGGGPRPQLRYIAEEEKEQELSIRVRDKGQNQYGDQAYKGVQGHNGGHGQKGGYRQNGGQSMQGIQSTSASQSEKSNPVPEVEKDDVDKEEVDDLESTESSSSGVNDPDDSDFDPNASGSG